MDALMHY